MSASNTDQLQHSLDQAISMQLRELPGDIDPDSDEALAHHIWQQEMAASSPLSKLSIAPARPSPRARNTTQNADQDCSSCLEPTSGRNLVVLGCCQSAFCKTCFRTWFDTALSGKTLPSCCGSNISIDTYGANLTAMMRKQYARVKEELNADRKIYCASTRCGKFIKIDQDSLAFVSCRFCKCKTCTTCKELMSAHGKRRTCRNYLDDKELEQILSSNQWKRCPSCFAPVEKINGCDNVKCTCGSTFCFRCGDRKKSEGAGCSCTRNTRVQPIARATAVRPGPVARPVTAQLHPPVRVRRGRRGPVARSDPEASAGNVQGQTQNTSGGFTWSSAWSRVSSWF